MMLKPHLLKRFSLTLESGINIGVRLLILGLFPGATLEYLIIAHCAFIYFQEKSFPVRLLALYWTVLCQPCAFINFAKIPCPVRLFHIVRLLDTPEYVLIKGGYVY